MSSANSSTTYLHQQPIRRSSLSTIAPPEGASSSLDGVRQTNFAESSTLAVNSPRTVSIAEDVFAVDNMGFNDNETSHDYQYPPTRRKQSVPGHIEDQRIRRASRQPASPLTNPRRASVGLARYLTVQNQFGNATSNKTTSSQSPHKTDTCSVFSYTDLSDDSTGSINKEFTFELLTTIGSIFYAIFLVVMAAIFYLTDMTKKTNGKHQMFNIALASIGIGWLGLLHYDIQKYKRRIIREMFPNGTIPPTALFDADADRLSTNTEVICNNLGRCELSKRSASMASLSAFMPAYRFLRGRHSGSFYLKCGMAAFCFGHIIHEGLRFGHQIYFFAVGDIPCQSYSQIILYAVRPIFAFYQLFMTFKYSNIIISKWTNLAQFGVMHLFGTSLAFWLGTIIDDAVDYYYLFHNKADGGGNGTGHNESFALNSSLLIDYVDEPAQQSESASAVIECLQNSASFQSSQILPYMYPFTIEYNLCLAAIWFMVWLHIGKNSNDAHPHPFQHTVTQDVDGNEDIHYESNMVIKADCHASNRGLFAGLFILLFSLVTMIIFFIAVSAENSLLTVYVHHTQEFLLTSLILLATVFAYLQTCRFDISPFHMSSHKMDIVLLLVPIPFYLLNNVLAMIADIHYANWSRVFLLILITIQVLLQTLFIADGMHRCSQSRRLRFQKPGREFVTFSIILNITSWIVYTFETKAAESYHNETPFYGENLWMIVSHTTLPLMLFYRFHASVLLAEIWKFAYEKAHPD